ncbi:unnamed protein product [Owenia fusiformis]|uniref:Uncharacterized protein n=1 Tax=Owenia fusiformis TaxID=6347 RepID=A0A8J1U5T8_OWEFU|nr:unnamed protein product [Owenia fusiformis]
MPNQNRNSGRAELQSRGAAIRSSMVSMATSEGTPSSRNKKIVNVILLNKEEIQLQVDVKGKVQDVLNQVCSHVGLRESEYFGLAQKVDNEYQFLSLDTKLATYVPQRWRINRMSTTAGKPMLTLYFRVQFYVDHVMLLKERVSRQLYYQQLKENVLTYNQLGNEEKSFLISSYAIQADLGTYNSSKHGTEYFDPREYFPAWVIDKRGVEYILQSMPAIHRDLRGMSRTEAQTQYIREVSMSPAAHNLHFYQLRKRKNDPLPNLWMGITSKGIDILEESRNGFKDTISSLLWPSIGKLNFVKKKFEIRVVGSSQKYIYYTGSDERSKYLLSLCINTHVFHMTMQHKLAELRHLQAEDQRRYKESYIYSDPVDLEWEREQTSIHGALSVSLVNCSTIDRKTKADQRISIISNSSSNTTSGIVSDRMHISFDDSSEGGERDIEVYPGEIMITAPPGGQVRLSCGSRNSKKSTTGTSGQSSPTDSKSGDLKVRGSKLLDSGIGQGGRISPKGSGGKGVQQIQAPALPARNGNGPRRTNSGPTRVPSGPKRVGSGPRLVTPTKPPLEGAVGGVSMATTGEYSPSTVTAAMAAQSVHTKIVTASSNLHDIQTHIVNSVPVANTVKIVDADNEHFYENLPYHKNKMESNAVIRDFCMPVHLSPTNSPPYSQIPHSSPLKLLPSNTTQVVADVHPLPKPMMSKTVPKMGVSNLSPKSVTSSIVSSYELPPTQVASSSYIGHPINPVVPNTISDNPYLNQGIPTTHAENLHINQAVPMSSRQDTQYIIQGMPSDNTYLANSGVPSSLPEYDLSSLKQALPVYQVIQPGAPNMNLVGGNQYQTQQMNLGHQGIDSTNMSLLPYNYTDISAEAQGLKPVNCQPIPLPPPPEYPGTKSQPQAAPQVNHLAPPTPHPQPQNLAVPAMTKSQGLTLTHNSLLAQFQASNELQRRPAGSKRKIHKNSDPLHEHHRRHRKHEPRYKSDLSNSSSDMSAYVAKQQRFDAKEKLHPDIAQLQKKNVSVPLLTALCNDPSLFSEPLLTQNASVEKSSDEKQTKVAPQRNTDSANPGTTMVSEQSLQNARPVSWHSETFNFDPSLHCGTPQQNGQSSSYDGQELPYGDYLLQQHCDPSQTSLPLNQLIANGYGHLLGNQLIPYSLQNGNHGDIPMPQIRQKSYGENVMA